MKKQTFKISRTHGAFKGYATGVGVFLGALIVTALASSIFVPQQATNADRIIYTNNATGYTMMVTSAGSVEINSTATPDGTYASGKDTINVKTNAPGYYLYLSMNNDDANGNRLYKDGDSTATNYLAPAAGDFATPAVLQNNTWGFALVGDGSSFSTSYEIPTPAITSTWAAVPLRSQAQLIKTGTAANADPGDNIDVYYGVKVTTALPAGIYSNTVNYTAIINGQITDIASISPERTNKLSGGETVTIATNLTATAANVGTVSVSIGGEECTGATATNAANGSINITCQTPAHGTGTYDVTVDIENYGKNYYIPNGIEYYQDAPAPGITNLTYMHEMTSEACDATATPLATDTTVPQVTLIDVRGKNGTGTIENPATGNNEQSYVVRKLADGNCWMVQNLNMTLNTGVTLNSITSDIGNATANRTWTPQNNTQTAVGTAWAQNGGDVARSFEPGEALYFPNGVGTGTADSYNNLTGSTTGQPWEHVGNYYNWYAATAGTGTAAMVDGNTAVDSICPKGWKLPDNSGSKSFLNLVTTTYGLVDNNATSATKLLQAPLNFVRDGDYGWSSGQVYYKGAHGHWWSTAAASATNAYYLSTHSTRVIPQYSTRKGDGLTVRCVAR